MSDVKYYRDEKGSFPVREFINDPRNGRIKASIYAAITALSMYGLDLINTERLSFIGRKDTGGSRIQGLYELRNEEKKWRIALYHDLAGDSFILLYGFKKVKQRQPDDILHARKAAIMYISRKEQGNVVTD